METIAKTTTLNISSPAFASKGFIPAKYTCEGENVNPALHVENIPQSAKSLTLIVEDPDAPGGTFDHWIVWNIRPFAMIIEDVVPGVEGKNSFGKTNYRGPCPPTGTHRYFFKVYALDKLLDVKAGAGKMEVEAAMQGHILAQGEIIGMYKKSK